MILFLGFWHWIDLSTKIHGIHTAKNQFGDYLPKFIQILLKIVAENPVTETGSPLHRRYTHNEQPPALFCEDQAVHHRGCRVYLRSLKFLARIMHNSFTIENYPG